MMCCHSHDWTAQKKELESQIALIKPPLLRDLLQIYNMEETLAYKESWKMAVARQQQIERRNKLLDLKFIWNYRSKLWAQGNRLWDESEKLKSEGNRLWDEAIKAVYGSDIKKEWQNWNEKYQSYECHLETGEIFGFEKGEVK